jgi:hypothetical protein
MTARTRRAGGTAARWRAWRTRAAKRWRGRQATAQRSTATDCYGTTQHRNGTAALALPAPAGWDSKLPRHLAGRHRGGSNEEEGGEEEDEEKEDEEGSEEEEEEEEENAFGFDAEDEDEEEAEPSPPVAAGRRKNAPAQPLVERKNAAAAARPRGGGAKLASPPAQLASFAATDKPNGVENSGSEAWEEEGLAVTARGRMQRRR